MSELQDDLGLRVEALEADGPALDWIVETADERVIFRCRSHQEAMNMRALVVRLSPEEVLALKVTSASVTSEYVKHIGLGSAESRFCDWALQQLGRVSITTSSHKSGSRFVVTNEGGQSGEGHTLAIALFGLVHCFAPLGETGGATKLN